MNGGRSLAEQGGTNGAAPVGVDGLLRELPACTPSASACAVHTASPAVAVCSVCGKPLCGDCAPAAEVEAACSSCRRPLKSHFRRLRGLLAPSLSSLWLLIGLSSVAYVASTAHRFSSFSAGEVTDRKELTRRCQLYMTKAARSDHYAEALETENRRDLARRRYRMAIQATERVLADFPETEFYRDLKGEARLETETRLRLSLVKFLIRSGQLDRARRELDRLLKGNPDGPSARLARFRYGEILETTSPHEAIREYEACQPDGGFGFDLATTDLFDAASLNPAARTFFMQAKGMAGYFDPAEAQARVIACHEKLGERLQAEAAYEKLVDRYPFSKQTKRLKEERGEADAQSRLPPLPFLNKQPWSKGQPSSAEQAEEEPPEETITVVPLE